jgi:hypothetical protein
MRLSTGIFTGLIFVTAFMAASYGVIGVIHRSYYYWSFESIQSSSNSLSLCYSRIGETAKNAAFVPNWTSPGIFRETGQKKTPRMPQERL